MWIHELTGAGALLATHSDIRQHCPTSFPAVITDEMLTAQGYKPVIDTPPTITATQTAVRGEPEKDVHGDWRFTYTITNLPVEEVASRLSLAKSAFYVKVEADVNAIIYAVVGEKGREYSDAFADALAFETAGFTGTPPESVAEWAAIKGQTDEWAAKNVLATGRKWMDAQKLIRRTRLQRKEDALQAVDFTALEAVKVQWDGFVAALRVQLGIGS